MVGDDIDDDLHAIVVSLRTECLQITLTSDTITDSVVLRTIDITPDITVTAALGDRRGLHSRETGLGNVGDGRLDILERPVETVEDDTILDIILQAVLVAGEGAERRAQHEHKRQEDILKIRHVSLFLNRCLLISSRQLSYHYGCRDPSEQDG